MAVVATNDGRKRQDATTAASASVAPDDVLLQAMDSGETTYKRKSL